MMAAAKEFSTNEYGRILLWCLVLAVVAIAGFLVATWARKRLRPTDEPQASGFSLDELRRLHKSGQLSDVEYERARSKVVAALLPKKPPGKT